MPPLPSSTRNHLKDTPRSSGMDPHVIETIVADARVLEMNSRESAARASMSD